MTRVGRVLQDLASAREVTDAEILQHAKDCTRLMEEAAERWQDGRESRETVELWMHRRDEALRSLSPSWKAAREAQIQQRIAEGATGCYFIDQADKARLALVNKPAGF